MISQNEFRLAQLRAQSAWLLEPMPPREGAAQPTEREKRAASLMRPPSLVRSEA
jgi:hypothetical protein